ncbi:hypothetical protein, partial [Mycobacterium lepromatosis]|uniref:hypothetical protein n=1 Tax=Mycobacterium lepromatosis TaxID=480418 RepID=UPI000A77A34C
MRPFSATFAYPAAGRHVTSPGEQSGADTHRQRFLGVLVNIGSPGFCGICRCSSSTDDVMLASS